LSVKQLATEWIRATETELNDSDDLHWSVDTVIGMPHKGQFPELWEFIKVVYQMEMADEAWAVLAAGPVEDLLAKAGAQYIDEVEALSRKDKTFRNLLGGVWQNTMPEDIWDRVCQARGACQKFCV
jgi:hypothetical protein